jgi:hypothetical protein
LEAISDAWDDADERVGIEGLVCVEFFGEAWEGKGDVT